MRAKAGRGEVWGGAGRGEVPESCRARAASVAAWEGAQLRFASKEHLLSVRALCQALPRALITWSIILLLSEGLSVDEEMKVKCSEKSAKVSFAIQSGPSLAPASHPRQTLKVETRTCAACV